MSKCNFSEKLLAIFVSACCLLIFFLSYTTPLPSSTLNPAWHEYYDFGLLGLANQISDIYVDTSNPALIYVLSQKGFYKSSDYGHNFTRLINGKFAGRILTIDEQRLAFSAYDGIYYSTNGGASWFHHSFVGLSAPVFGPSEEYLYFGRVFGQCLPHQGICGIYRLNLNTHQVEYLLNKEAKHLLYIPERNALLAYHENFWWTSEDAGQNWQEQTLSVGEPGERVYFIGLVPDVETGTIYALTLFINAQNQRSTGLIKSDDSGSSWVIINRELLPGVNPLRLYADNGKLYVLADPGKGIYVSDNGGLNWSELNNGFSESQIPSVMSLGFGASDFYNWAIYAGDALGKIYRLGAQPKDDPVIYIHGLGGHFTDWTTGNKSMHFEALREAGYPEHYLNTYAYADADGNPDTYDSQADVRLISADLDEQVNTLSQLSLEEGGSGKVDLVGFSLGGIIARYYLNQHGEEKVDDLVTIGSPHLGAEILHFEDWIEMIPWFGVPLRKAFGIAFHSFFDSVGYTPPDPNSPAAQQVRPSSQFIEDLNTSTYVSVDGYTGAGDIDVKLNFRFFFWDLTRKFSIGDGLMTTTSASSLPCSDKISRVFSEPSFVVAKHTIQNSIDIGYKYQVDLVTTEDLNYWHGMLIRQSDVVESVIKWLTHEW
ncbi:alpha/beta fold hydrolase [Patescibacteria group bacterium]|nr:alpha/beta fold hydrolase [Patescibacteria group bacterium]MBU1868135.1 alpha/beta fold hydrolase [Patescibacteria group bacterium]